MTRLPAPGDQSRASWRASEGSHGTERMRRARGPRYRCETAAIAGLHDRIPESARGRGARTPAEGDSKMKSEWFQSRPQPRQVARPRETNSRRGFTFPQQIGENAAFGHLAHKLRIGRGHSHGHAVALADFVLQDAQRLIKRRHQKIDNAVADRRSLQRRIARRAERSGARDVGGTHQPRAVLIEFSGVEQLSAQPGFQDRDCASAPHRRRRQPRGRLEARDRWKREQACRL